MATTISFFRTHKRLSITVFSWVAFCAFTLIPNWREGPFCLLFFSAIFLMLIASQVSGWVASSALGNDSCRASRGALGLPRLRVLSVCSFSLLQHRPLHQSLGHPAGRFDPLDAAKRSVSSAFLVVVGGVVGRFRHGDGFLDGRPSRARRSVGLRQSAQGCGRPRRHAHAWCDIT